MLGGVAVKTAATAKVGDGKEKPKWLVRKERREKGLPSDSEEEYSEGEAKRMK